MFLPAARPASKGHGLKKQAESYPTPIATKVANHIYLTRRKQSAPGLRAGKLHQEVYLSVQEVTGRPVTNVTELCSMRCCSWMLKSTGLKIEPSTLKHGSSWQTAQQLNRVLRLLHSQNLRLVWI